MSTTLVEQLSSALDTSEAAVLQWLARYRGETAFVLLTAVSARTVGSGG